MMGTSRRHGEPTGRLGRFFATREGASALEFAILAPVFFGIVFAIIETFVAYAAEQVLLNANDAMARRIRMGEITFDMGRPTDVDEKEFRALFCAEFVVLLSCSDDDTTVAPRLHIDVRSLANFGGSADVLACPDSNTFTPGGKQTTNIVRSCYRWPIIVDYLRLVSLHGSSDNTIDGQNLVATAVFRNEDYP
ncbi:pilus assembly protein [Rhizobium sp. TRM96647]|uniref:TadE/TadG family type IV pilus assembly protein n=1 Tax=unclassified Rhizobium TaxID=2613769 RepID=UPI0021E836EE|nr:MULTISPECIES: TadE/TadG family type IV pilus assembly protein [unclassified Rhizobium]MCV3736355.1 pilus assembly protein [Rhizobium sp. TRM96647]MCV3758724.1 pilus assembly protein [Rhizobium sp. TRM96650]